MQVDDEQARLMKHLLIISNYGLLLFVVVAILYVVKLRAEYHLMKNLFPVTVERLMDEAYRGKLIRFLGNATRKASSAGESLFLSQKRGNIMMMDDIDHTVGQLNLKFAEMGPFDFLERKMRKFLS